MDNLPWAQDIKLTRQDEFNGKLIFFNTWKRRGLRGIGLIFQVKHSDTTLDFSSQIQKLPTGNTTLPELLLRLQQKFVIYLNTFSVLVAGISITIKKLFRSH
jgi:hypothetical protein